MDTPKTHGTDLRVDNRKDLLLMVLGADGIHGKAEPVVGVTRLQKYLYLLQEDHHLHRKFQLAQPYEFEAYDFGPFDSQIYDDLQFLENAHLIKRELGGPEPAIEDDEARWLALETGTVDRELAPWEEEDRVPCFALTDKGKTFLERYIIDAQDWNTISQLKREWNARPLQDLLRWLYKTHPEAARNTKLTHLRDE